MWRKHAAGLAFVFYQAGAFYFKGRIEGNLRDKEVEKGGVVWGRRHGRVASIHEDVIPEGEGEQSSI